MEREFFSWEDWDQLDVGCNVYYRCVLKVPIGPYDVGATIAQIVIDVDKGELRIFQCGDIPDFICNLHFRLGSVLVS